MSKVIIGLSTSVDGMASGTTEDDFMAVHEAVLGWVFNLRSWQAAQGMEGGHDTAESPGARSSGGRVLRPVMRLLTSLTRGVPDQLCPRYVGEESAHVSPCPWRWCPGPSHSDKRLLGPPPLSCLGCRSRCPLDGGRLRKEGTHRPLTCVFGGPRGTRTHNLRIKSRFMPVSLPAASCPSRHICAGQRRADDGGGAGVSTALPARVRWFGRSLGRSRGVQVAREPEPAHLVAMADWTEPITTRVLADGST
jgi:hypothetical protein